MLDDRQHAARKRAVHHRTAERDDNVRIVAEGAVADDLVRATFRHVEHGRAIDIDARVAEFLCQAACFAAAGAVSYSLPKQRAGGMARQ